MTNPPAPTPPPTYAAGSVKQNPETLDVAVRVAQGPAEWLVATLSNGGHFAVYAEVKDWADLPKPAAPVPAPPAPAPPPTPPATGG